MDNNEKWIEVVDVAQTHYFSQAKYVNGFIYGGHCGNPQCTKDMHFNMALGPLMLDVNRDEFERVYKEVTGKAIVIDTTFANRVLC